MTLANPVVSETPPATRIYLSPPHRSGEEQKLVAEGFASNWIAPLGPHVDGFERELAEYAKIDAAVALSSGTAALHLALRLLGVGPGDTVFCSDLTFVASVNPILYQGAEPVFIDAEPESWCMSPAALRRGFEWAQQTGPMPKAVIVVNLYGQSADLDPLLAECNRFGVPVIEDAAESLGATYKGKASGTLGRFGVFSFNGNKIITTSGGGMLVSDDIESIEKARYWSTQARDPAPHYQHSEVGYNYRLSNLLAAVGRGQLRVLDDRVNARRAVFEHYASTFSDVEGFHFMPDPAYGRSNRWLTVLTVDESKCGVTCNQLMDALGSENIESRPVWKPMHLQPLYERARYFSHTPEENVSEAFFERGICLPSGSSLRPEDLDRITRCIRARLDRA